MALVFFLALIVFLYTFAGYPLILALWSRFAAAKIAEYDSIETTPTLDIIMVVHNGAEYIEEKLTNLVSLNYPGKQPGIIVVLDACTDQTRALIDAMQLSQVTVLEQQEKRGKPAGLNLAVATSQAELLFMTDVRQPIQNDAVEKMLRRFSDPQMAAVSGELVFRQEGISDFGKGMDAYWRYEKFIRERESRVGSVAGVTGAIYLLRRSFYKPIPDETLLDDVLIPMQAVLAGGKVKFESGAYAFDIPSNDIEREKARKTRTLAGNFQLVQLNPALANPLKNPIWFQFVSHKLLRLLSPFLLVIIFVSNFFLVDSHVFFTLTLLAQIVLYGMALAAFASESLRCRKPLSIIHSFMNLMLYTFYGFLAYARGNYSGLWK